MGGYFISVPLFDVDFINFDLSGRCLFTKNSTLRVFCGTIGYHRRKQCAVPHTLFAPVIFGAKRENRVMHSDIRKCRIAFSWERWLHKGKESLEENVVCL